MMQVTIDGYTIELASVADAAGFFAALHGVAPPRAATPAVEPAAPPTVVARRQGRARDGAQRAVRVEAVPAADAPAVQQKLVRTRTVPIVGIANLLDRAAPEPSPVVPPPPRARVEAPPAPRALPFVRERQFAEPPPESLSHARAYETTILEAFARDQRASLHVLASRIFGGSTGSTQRQLHVALEQLIAEGKLERVSMAQYRVTAKVRVDVEDLDQEDDEEEVEEAPARRAAVRSDTDD